MQDARKTKRITVDYQVSFSTTRVGTGAGTILNLSMAGGSMKSDIPVPRHTYLTLRINVSDTEPAVLIDLAVVRWARGNEHGLEFLNVASDQRERLTRLIERTR